MPKRNRIAALLMVPIAVFLWCIGWGLYYTGWKKEKTRPKAISEANNLTFAVLLPEKQIET
jgi:hypothetical protein